jgi:hypothetical protein
MGIDQLAITILTITISTCAIIISLVNYSKRKELEAKLRITKEIVRGQKSLDSPADILSRHGFDKNHLTVRPLLPEDIEKSSWDWRDNESFKTPSYRLLELTGIDCGNGKLAAVSLFSNELNIMRIGLLTSWDNSARVIINPSIPVYVRQIEIGGEKSERFALRGKVYEPEGAYIA